MSRRSASKWSPSAETDRVAYSNAFSSAPSRSWQSPRTWSVLGFSPTLQKKLIEIADQLSVALESEGMRRLALESRCPREPATHGRSGARCRSQGSGRRLVRGPGVNPCRAGTRLGGENGDVPVDSHPPRLRTRAWERILESSGSADTGLIEAGGSRVVSLPSPEPADTLSRPQRPAARGGRSGNHDTRNRHDGQGDSNPSDRRVPMRCGGKTSRSALQDRVKYGSGTKRWD